MNRISPHDLTIDKLKTFLLLKSINLSLWENKIYKSVENLYEEIRNDDCILTDEPLRIIYIAVINILYNNTLLIEGHQKMKNGSIRFRNKPPREKIKIGESIRIAAIRCLQEELNLLPNQFNIISIDATPKIYLKESDSYPGLITKYHQFDVTVHTEELPNTDFETNENGEEHDPVESHFWKWMPLNKSNLK